MRGWSKIGIPRFPDCFMNGLDDCFLANTKYIMMIVLKKRIPLTEITINFETWENLHVDRSWDYVEKAGKKEFAGKAGFGLRGKSGLRRNLQVKQDWDYVEKAG